MLTTPFIVLWFVLALVTLGLAVYRKLIAMREDDYIHVGPGQDALITKQISTARKLDLIDRWGKALTVVTLAAGMVIAAAYMYQAWTATQ